MPVETIDPSGRVRLRRAFYGGWQERDPTGLRPSELLNPVSSLDRQKVFYSGIAELGRGSFVWSTWWRDGGLVSTLQSEFSTAFDTARQVGVAIPDTVLRGYKERIVSFGALQGMYGCIRYCDGAIGVLADMLPPENYMKEYGWKKGMADLIVKDPAIAIPLEWIRQWGENGTLARYWHREVEGDTKAMDEFIEKAAEMLRNSSGWKKQREQFRIAEGIEESLLEIALKFWVVEDMPDLHRAGVLGNVEFSKKVEVQPRWDRPNMGFMPFDDVFWSNLDKPTGILEAKGVFLDMPEILKSAHDFFTFMDNNFPGGRKMSGRIPSECTVKDLKRYAKVWDLLVGGSQGTSLTDFSKFGEAIFSLCNLYANIPNRADVLGWMVGEAVYMKTLAVMAGTKDRGFWDQLFKVLSLGGEDTPRELAAAAGGVLGESGEAAYGAIAAAIKQFGLRVGTEHYRQAVAMLKTGIADPQKALRIGQPLLIAAAFVNRMTGGARRR